MHPLEEYTARLAERQGSREELQRRFIQIGNARLVIGLCFAVLAWVVFGPGRLPGWILGIPTLAFVALVIWHTRVTRRRELRDRAVRFYQSGLGRLQDNWAGTGPSGDRFQIKDHIYANDLDIFGTGSLFEFVSRARTTMGENMLARWLLNDGPSSPVDRQGAVRELSARLDLREDIALLGSDVRAEMNPDRLLSWATGVPERFGSGWRPTALGLAVAGVTAIVLLFLALLPLTVVVAIIAADAAFIYVLRSRVTNALQGLARVSRDLEVLSELLKRLETERFESTELQRLREALVMQGKSASGRIAQLAGIMDWLYSGDNPVVRVFRPILLWREQCAIAADAWRCRNGEHIGRWITAVGVFEALSSLASLSYERPEWKFPNLAVDAKRIFSAKNLLHPLIPAAHCVPNNVTLGDDVSLLIISGSNMSGKSTLLRAIGLNTVLARIGAPVAATELTISTLQLGVSIRIADSLQDNRSRFYAEITRLQQILRLTGNPAPVLFLLDELLSGTNSRDRKTGATAVVKAMVQRGGIGCITTHDLALAEIEGELATRAVNAHFEDQIIDGEMIFDYKLRPGIVTHSNALELMRAIGLPV